MPKISLHFIFSSKKNLLLSFLLFFLIQFHALLAQQTLFPGATIYVCEGVEETLQALPVSITAGTTATLTSELYTFYIESSGGLPIEIQSGTSSSVLIIADGGTALNSVKDGDVITGVVTLVFSDPLAPGGVSYGIGTISSTIKVVSLNPGALDTSQSRTISYNTSPGLLGNGTTGSDATYSDGTLSYQWEQSADSADWNDIPGATSLAYTPPSLTATTYFRRNAFVSTSIKTGCSSTTNAIQITVSPFTDPSTGFNMTSSAVSDTFCTGELITFTASGSTSYEFLVNGAVVQPRSSSNTYSTVLTQSSSVTVLGDTLSQTITLPLYFNSVEAATISGTQQICYGESISLNVVSHGSVQGNLLIGESSGFYQWQSSLDLTNWTDIPNAITSSLTIPSLLKTTYFRLNTVNTVRGVLCFDSSNWVEISVVPQILAGTIDQLDYVLCSGETPQELTITGGSSGPSILYQWQRSFDGGITYEDIDLETNKSLLTYTVTQTARYRRLTYTAVGSCTVASNDITIEFDDISPGSLDPTQSTILCYNSIPPEITNGDSGEDAHSRIGSITYQWESSLNEVTWSAIESGTLSYYLPSTTLTQTTWFRRVAISTTASRTCTATTNAIQFLVYPEIDEAIVSGDQTVCEDDIPEPLNLLGASTDLGITHQWQSSLDNIAFSDISNRGTSLTFTNSTSWTPNQTTYFRVLSYNSAGCTVTSTVAKITVIEKPYINQKTGTSPLQYVCPGSAIVSTTFEFGGSATDLTVTGLVGSGLTLDGPVDNQYILSGTPVRDVVLTLTTDVVSPCTLVSLQYNIQFIEEAAPPTVIRKQVDDEDHTLFQIAELWHNNTICQGDFLTTPFYVCEESTATENPSYEWRVEPGIAGVMNTTTGEITWNPTFVGTATIGVRALSCGGNSDWLETPVEVVSPTAITSELTTPTVLEDPLCGLESSEIPGCKIDESTANTQFYATTASGKSDYASIEWSLEDIFPGGGLTGVSSPGVIDPQTGEMDWNPGFWGSLSIVATPINCEGTQGPSSRITISLLAENDATPTLLEDITFPFPECPTSEGDTSRIISDLAVDWSLDNPNAGTITSIDNFTGEITWNSDFSGWVEIIASATESCTSKESSINVYVPGKAKILTTEIGVGNITLCQGTYLNGVEYTIEGFPTFATASNLPEGITGILSATHHIVDFVYNGIATKGQTYRIDILGQMYAYTVSDVTESADQVVMGLQEVITSTSGARFSATKIALNTLRLEANVAGFRLAGALNSYPSAVQLVDINTVSSPKRTFTLTGTVTADPGIYDYTVYTSGGSISCSQATKQGRFTITGISSITLLAGSEPNQEICVGEAILPIEYQVDYAIYAKATGLPEGLTQSFTNTRGLVISGTPTEQVTQTTVFEYQIETLYNENGCSPEATASGTITLQPQQLIALVTASGTEDQTICNSGSNSQIDPIIYQLSGSTEGFETANLPPGIIAAYDSNTHQITLSGSPSVQYDSTTAFEYSIMTTGSLCDSVELKGMITIEPSPSISLTSSLESSLQVGTNGICVGSPIIPIVYTLRNTSSARVVGLPSGVTASQSGNAITISGIPDEAITDVKNFKYTLTTENSACGSEVSISGYIDVNPIPSVDEAYITANDVTPVSCYGAADGSILIPSDSPEFELRIQGGQKAIAQVDRVTLENQPELGDVYSITIDGISFEHTVVASFFGGPTQTPTDVAQALVYKINTGSGLLESPALASFESPSEITLISKNPEIPFTVQTSLMTSYSGLISPTLSNTNLVSHVMLNYTYLWTGPNGFSSSNLSISNLEPGEYSLTVSLGNCSSDMAQATFTIEEPDPIDIETSLCNGAFQATISGGVGPYSLQLYNSSDQLLRSDFTTAIQNYTDLTPGANYRLVVTDAQCEIAKETAFTLPFEMSFDDTVPRIVNDYCNDGTGSGLIELGGNTTGEAFSGGSGQFSYEWIGGPSGNFHSTSRDIYGLEAANYTVTVTDLLLGCSDTFLFTIETVDPLVIDLAESTELNSNGKIDLACNGDETAAIEVSVSGGLGNYSYAWTRNGNAIVGSNSPKLANLGVGFYTLAVSDAAPAGTGIEPCTLTRTFEVEEPDALQLIVNTGTSTKTFCPSSTNSAQFDIQILGGSPPYTVTLTSSNGAVRKEIIASNAKQSITGLNPSEEGNTYTISVEDANNCGADLSPSEITFESIEAIEVDVKVQQIDCKNGILGSITLDLINGTLSNPEDVQIQWKSADSNLYHTWATNNGTLDNISTGGKYNIVVSQDGCVLFETTNIEITDIDAAQLAVSVVSENSGSCDNLGRIELALSGGVTPYTIYWEVFTAVVSSSLSTTSSQTSSTLVTQTIEQWERVPRLENNAIAADLTPGVYRAIVMDNSSSVNGVCGGPWVSRNFNIANQRFDIINFNSTMSETSCDESSYSAQINFTILNTIPNPSGNQESFKISLDGIDITSSIATRGNQYYYEVFSPGDHILSVEPFSGTETPTASSTQCSALHAFTLEELSPIIYEGKTEFELDVCEDFIELTLDSTAVQGGVPFIVDGTITYDYRWEYTPDSTVNRGPQTYVGDTVLEAYPGTYELVISDQRLSCPSLVQTLIVRSKEGSSPFVVSGVLEQVSTASTGSITTVERVKALAPNCESTTENGRIGIEINGGIKPYTIKWFKEEIDSETNSVTLVEISSAFNSTQLYNLSSGKYKVEIQSEGTNGCSLESGLNQKNYHEEYIFVPKNEQLYIIDGPFIDQDLCQGLPGRLSIELYDNLQEGLTFYYNNEIVSLAENQPAKEGNYILLIDKPVEQATLLITNREGCVVSTEVQIVDIGLPDFEYRSPSYEANGTILAREEITFTNTSALPYSISEWNFGDGTEKQRVVSGRTVSPTLHTYGISGVYFVTLRNFNELGCYEEITKQVTVGKGYNILVPNIFSPNNDGINDFFRPLFSGFEQVSFRVYDERGNLLYEEKVQEPDMTYLSGIELKGWSGDNATGAPYYIYQFSGTLITDQSLIERSGTFVLIR